MVEKQHLRAVWLDLDDTLWDFKANSRVALRQLYEQAGLNRWFTGVEDWIARYEQHNHALWAQYNRAEVTKDYLMAERFSRPLSDVGCTEAVELAARFDTWYLDLLAECRELVPGAVELLTWLREQGYLIGVLSNGFTQVQHRKMSNSGLSPLVDAVVLSDDIGVNKPDVRLFDYAARQLGVKPGECLMVGDNPDTDIAGALAAGWQAIYFDRSGGESTGVCTVDSLEKIKNLL